MFHPSGEVTIDALAKLVDINLNDFEHSITFGNRPLFTPPVCLDTAALRAIGTLQPRRGRWRSRRAVGDLRSARIAHEDADLAAATLAVAVEGGTRTPRAGRR